MFIGKINRVFGYDKWLVKADDKKETRNIPIGSFVKINDSLIGAVVGHLQDVPDDYLSNDITGETSENIFINELEEENAYFKILGIGEIGKDEYKIRSPPPLKEEVYLLDKEEIKNFHRKEDGYSFEYYSDIIDFEKVKPEIVMKVLDKLLEVFSNEQDVENLLKALKKHTRSVK